MKTCRLALMLVTLAVASRATTLYTVTLDTSGLGALVGLEGGQVSLGFQLADGSGTGDGNNSVSLSAFNFGVGGGANGSAILIGGASGSVSSSVNLTDSGMANIFIQSFVPGDVLQFDLLLTGNVDPGTPDEFIMSLLDSGLNPIPTTSSSSLFPLIAIDFDSANPTVQTFGCDANNFSTDAFPLPCAAPIVTVPSEVPEPSTGVPIAISLALITWKIRQRRSRLQPTIAS